MRIRTAGFHQQISILGFVINNITLSLISLSVFQEVGCGASLGVISESLLVTGGQGCVSFWELNYGDLLQTVYLGQSSEGQGVRQLLVLDNAAIVCDFGSKLSLVYVPSVLEKLDWTHTQTPAHRFSELSEWPAQKHSPFNLYHHRFVADMNDVSRVISCTALHLVGREWPLSTTSGCNGM